jgi:hypothetical protein
LFLLGLLDLLVLSHLLDPLHLKNQWLQLDQLLHREILLDLEYQLHL